MGHVQKQQRHCTPLPCPSYPQSPIPLLSDRTKNHKLSPTFTQTLIIRRGLAHKTPLSILPPRSPAQPNPRALTHTKKPPPASHPCSELPPHACVVTASTGELHIMLSGPMTCDSISLCGSVVWIDLFIIFLHQFTRFGSPREQLLEEVMIGEPAAVRQI